VDSFRTSLDYVQTNFSCGDVVVVVIVAVVVVVVVDVVVIV